MSPPHCLGFTTVADSAFHSALDVEHAPSDAEQMKIIFDAAKEAGDFALFFSFDMSTYLLILITPFPPLPSALPPIPVVIAPRISALAP